MTPGRALSWVLILLPHYFLLVIVVTIKENLMDFVRTAAKAVIGAIVSGVASFAAAKGIDLTDAQVSALTLFLTGLAVYFTRNKPAT